MQSDSQKVTASYYHSPSSHYFTETQQHVILGIQRFTATLSLVGSVLIIYMVYMHLHSSISSSQVRKKKTTSSATTTKPIYHRLICSMAVVYFLMSVWLIIGRVAVPKELQINGAYGTKQSCTLQGFSLMWLCVSSYFLTTALMLYYLLTIRYGGGGWLTTTAAASGARKSAHYVEPIIYFTVIVIPLLMAIIGIALQIFNPMPGAAICLVSDFPFGCSTTAGVECIRGEKAMMYSVLFIIIPAAIILPILFGSIICIYLTIRQRELQSDKFVFRRTDSALSHITNNSDTTTARRSNSKQELKRTKKVGRQCLLYFVAFFNSYVWAFIEKLTYVHSSNVTTKFVFTVVTVTFFPSLGFFYFIIYAQPKYARIRKLYPEKRVCRVMCETITGEKCNDDNSNTSNNRSKTGSDHGSTSINNTSMSSLTLSGYHANENTTKQSYLLVDAVRQEEEEDEEQQGKFADKNNNNDIILHPDESVHSIRINLDEEKPNSNL